MQIVSTLIRASGKEFSISTFLFTPLSVFALFRTPGRASTQCLVQPKLDSTSYFYLALEARDHEGPGCPGDPLIRTEYGRNALRTRYCTYVGQMEADTPTSNLGLTPAELLPSDVEVFTALYGYRVLVRTSAQVRDCRQLNCSDRRD
jgi:hypothetical protein